MESLKIILILNDLYSVVYIGQVIVSLELLFILMNQKNNE